MRVGVEGVLARNRLAPPPPGGSKSHSFVLKDLSLDSGLLEVSQSLSVETSSLAKSEARLVAGLLVFKAYFNCRRLSEIHVQSIFGRNRQC